jgi:hypothetical protein
MDIWRKQSENKVELMEISKCQWIHFQTVTNSAELAKANQHSWDSLETGKCVPFLITKECQISMQINIKKGLNTVKLDGNSKIYSVEAIYTNKGINHAFPIEIIANPFNKSEFKIKFDRNKLPEALKTLIAPIFWKNSNKI